MLRSERNQGKITILLAKPTHHDEVHAGNGARHVRRVPENRGACRNRGIADPSEFDRESLQAELYICHKKLEELKARAPLLRHQHLKQRLTSAKVVKNEKTIADIKRIMQREASRKRWARTNYSSKKRNGGVAVVSVKVKLSQGVT